MVLLTVTLSLSSCATLRPAPKLDIGILKVTKLGENKFKVEGLFENKNGTEYAIDASKLDKFLVVRADQAIDMIAWLNEVMVLFKAELFRR